MAAGNPLEIAVIGWGSLIWCPGNLRIKTRWRSGGPPLPIEFGRISKDMRLTLVILPGSPNQQTYWALSEFGVIEEARQNLRQREGTKPADIHFLLKKGEASKDVPLTVREQIAGWLNQRNDVDAALWTGLPGNWGEKRGKEFSPKDAVEYLVELENDKDSTQAAYDRARQYVVNAPPGIDTPVRKEMRLRGWLDAQLPQVLFEEEP